MNQETVRDIVHGLLSLVLANLDHVMCVYDQAVFILTDIM
jgi:hypothetical protein